MILVKPAAILFAIALISMLILAGLSGLGISSAVSAISIPVSEIQVEEDAFDIFFDSLYEGVEVTDKKSHGLAKHGADYVWVQECLRNPGAHIKSIIMLRQNDDPVKKLKICYIDEVIFGFQVFKRIGGSKLVPKWGERTAYIQSEVKSISELERFIAAYKEYFPLHRWVEAIIQ